MPRYYRADNGKVVHLNGETMWTVMQLSNGIWMRIATRRTRKEAREYIKRQKLLSTTPHKYRIRQWLEVGE